MSASEKEGKVYKVGVVGLRRGRSFANLFNSYERTEVTALCDTQAEILERTNKNLGLKDSHMFADYDDFINADMDIVVIATPIPLHADEAIKAMEMGKNVLSEVTAADTIANCQRIISAVKRTGRTYMMAENMNYVHFIRQWKEIISQGKLGEIFYAEAEYIHEIRNLIVDKESGKPFWRAHRPPLHYSSHSLGPLLYLMDDRIIKATASGQGKDFIPDVGPGAISIQVALFETQKGATIKLLRSSLVARRPAFHYYSLYGTKGAIENGRDGDTGQLYIEGEEGFEQGAKAIECAIADPNAPEEARKGGHGTSEYYLIRDFIYALDTNTRPPIDVIKAMDYTVPGIIAHEAAMQGNVWLDVPLFEY
jgi:predicted dehydrogenase